MVLSIPYKGILLHDVKNGLQVNHWGVYGLVIIIFMPNQFLSYKYILFLHRLCCSVFAQSAC